jgi:membrane-associated protease RseP (regulator of RpoE activity)
VEPPARGDGVRHQGDPRRWLRQDRRDDPLEEIAPEDEPRAFYRQSAGKKAIVLAAGSTVHFLIAIALIFGSALAIGRAVEKSPGLETIAACVPVAADQTCEDPGALPSPAEQAGCGRATSSSPSTASRSTGCCPS